MNISEIVSYDKDGEVVRFPLFRKLFLSLMIILVALLSFGLGRLSVVGERGPIRIEYDPQLTADDKLPTTNIEQSASVINATQNIQATPNEEGVVVSKNGIRYHYLHCSGAKQIKDENKIFFASPALAEGAGYTLAANCRPR